MPHAPAQRDQHIAELEQRLAALHAQAERDQRALEAVYNICLACRGSTAFRQVFEATYRELQAVFPLDACYIALCDSDQPDVFRAVLLVDEGVAEYDEHVEIGELTGLLVRERQPRLFHDLAEERDRLLHAPDPFGNQQKRSRSWLGVPLLVSENAVGVISIQSYQPDLYNNADVGLLQRVGNVVAVALENVALDQQQRDLSAALATQVAERTVELSTLSAIAAELVLQRPLPSLLERALDLIVPLFELDGGTVRVIDQRRETLDLVAQRGFSPEYIQFAGSVAVATSTQGEVVRKNRPLVIASGLRPSAPPSLGQAVPFESLLSVPLRSRDRVLGTLSLVGHHPANFRQQEVDLAQAIANQIAIAVENAQLFAEQARQIQELRALGNISRAASTTRELRSLLRLVHDALQSFMRLDAFSMVVYDAERQVVIDGISIDEGQEFAYWVNQPPPADSLTAWVIRHRRTLHFRDIAAEIGQYPELSRHLVGSGKHAVAWLGVPLLNQDGASIGAFALQSYRADAFSERDEAFLASMAGQVALHVQNVRLLRQRERQIQELDAIGRIGQLISASYDFREMLDGVYRTLDEVARPSVFYLLICEPDSRRVTNAIFIEAGTPINLPWAGSPPPPGSLTDWIMTQREPVLFHDLVNQRQQLLARGIAPVPLGPDNPVRSWIGVPLLAKDGELIGVLSLQDYQSHRYDDQTIDFLNQIASHISLGVQKVRLFDERERQIEENARLFAAEQAARRTADTLREVARVLNSSFDSREVLQLMLQELHNVIAYDTASIMLIEREALRVAAYRGMESSGVLEELTALKGFSFRFRQRSAAWRVVNTREPLVIADTVTSPDWSTEDNITHIRSWIGVPLVSKGAVLGVLNIDSRHFDHFSARDVEVAQAFANQAAVALENARLYEESVARVEQELEIARRIQSNLFPHALPQLAGIELDARCLPARETGGDFYDFVELGAAQAPDVLGLVVGDASGKSIPGAMLMAIARSITRSEARDHQVPQVVMRETNSWIVHDVPPRSFVALCYATIDVRKRRLALANAGQLTPIRRDRAGQLTFLDPPGPRLPLGILPDTAYESLDVELAPGDLLVFVTDGIVEAKNAAGQLFGFERLEEIVRDHGELAPSALIEQVLGAVREFMGAAPQHDDMTIVALRVTYSNPT